MTHGYEYATKRDHLVNYSFNLLNKYLDREIIPKPYTISISNNGQVSLPPGKNLVFNIIPKLQERIPAHYLGPTIDGAVAEVERLIRKGAPNPSAAGQSYDEALKQYKQRRTLIESHIWNSLSTNESTNKHLSEMNEEFAGIISATLRFGVDEILSRKMAWGQHLVNSYRISEEDARAYLSAYHQAAKTHLDGAGKIVAEMFEEIAAEQPS